MTRQVRRAWGVAAFLIAVAAGLVAQGLQGSATAGGCALGAASSRRHAPGARRGILAWEGLSARPVAVRPAALRIASIGVDTPLVGLGLNADETVEVPQDAEVAGWYDLGPLPGDDGSAVILGHVDSVAGPAVFYRLSQLVAGDRVEVRLSDGSVAEFRVDRVATYDNEEFPAQQVYAGSPGRATLNLVTCGGVYDATRGGYQSNVVVFAESVEPQVRSSRD